MKHEIETLIEKRFEEMISPYDNNNPTWRYAYFLKPCFSPPSNSPLFLNPIKTHFSNFHAISSRVNFHGWRSPSKQWGSWVESLRPEFEPLWRKTSIDQAIKASTFDIPRHYDLIFALAQRFSPDTNTFVFPWGEASITLEDVMILGGYPVTGDSVLASYNSKELCEIEGSLHGARMEIVRSKCKKASLSKWAEKWMGKGVEFEHEAFLSLWLSRAVFPSDSFDSMNKSVFPIAVLLARGTKIALAPAVLARMYRDLRCLKEKIESLGDGNDEDVTKLNLWSPFLLLQLWVWERFPTLSPKPNPITIDQPRLARWSKVSILKKDDVGLALDSAKQCFVWRPYTKPLNKWSSCVKLYPKMECWVVVGVDVVNLDLESYVRFIRISELVGFECIEQYLPHRVSMQFGFDQDVPISIPRLNSDHEIAWSNYNRPIRNGKLYVPSRFFESDVTSQYLQWWKKLSIVKVESCSIQRLTVKLENNEPDIPPGFSCRSKMMIEDVCSYQSSSKIETYKDFGVGIKSNEVNPPCGSWPQMKGVEVGDDLTLRQLIHHKKSKGRKKGLVNVNHYESPLSSAGENASIRKSASVRRGSSEKDEIESRTLSMDKEEAKTGLLAPKYEQPDLLARLSGVERITNMVKAFKLWEQKKIQH